MGTVTVEISRIPGGGGHSISFGQGYRWAQGRIQEFEKEGAQHTVFFRTRRQPRNSRKSQKS